MNTDTTIHPTASEQEKRYVAALKRLADVCDATATRYWLHARLAREIIAGLPGVRLPDDVLAVCAKGAEHSAASCEKDAPMLNAANGNMRQILDEAIDCPLDSWRRDQ